MIKPDHISIRRFRWESSVRAMT